MVSLFFVVVLVAVGVFILSFLIKLLPESFQKEIGDFLRDMLRDF